MTLSPSSSPRCRRRFDWWRCRFVTLAPLSMTLRASDELVANLKNIAAFPLTAIYWSIQVYSPTCLDFLRHIHSIATLSASIWAIQMLDSFILYAFYDYLTSSNPVMQTSHHILDHRSDTCSNECFLWRFIDVWGAIIFEACQTSYCVGFLCDFSSLNWVLKVSITKTSSCRLDWQWEVAWLSKMP